MAAFTSAWPAKPQAVHRRRLGSTRVPVRPARRAPLARERGSDLLHPARGLVLQPAHQQAPPGPQNAPFSPAFCRTFRPGSPRVPLADRVCSRSSGPQPGSRRTAARCRCWPSPPGPCAGPSPGRAAGRSRGSPDRGVRSPPGAGQSALQPPPPPPLPPGQGRAVQQFARGQRRETATPRSIPTASPMPGAGTGSGTAAKATCQRPARSWVTR